MINLAGPLCLCGYTPDGKMVVGGAFQLADTNGTPLWFAFEQAREKGCVISIPHYFASAMEAGWDDVKTFGRIEEGLRDSNEEVNMESIKNSCILIFMEVAKTMPGQPATEIGKRLRELIESDDLANFIWTSPSSPVGVRAI